MQRFVDLSLSIQLDCGPRPMRAERVPPPDAAQVAPDQWYVMHRLEFLDHIGTHLEAPYHVARDGWDVAGIPLDRLAGEAVLLDLTAVQCGLVSMADVQNAATRAGGIRRDDIVFCRFRQSYGNEDPFLGEPPTFSAEAIAWLVDRGMKMLGVDLGGIELPYSDPRAAYQHNHHQLLSRNIPLIENLTNLDAISGPRFLTTAFPVGVAGIDAFPVRVVAWAL
jgi:arylformamidase